MLLASEEEHVLVNGARWALEEQSFVSAYGTDTSVHSAPEHLSALKQCCDSSSPSRLHNTKMPSTLLRIPPGGVNAVRDSAHDAQ